MAVVTQTVEVREKPILFSGPMIRAILEGRKTQTRRVVKPQPDYLWNEEPCTQASGYCKGPAGFKSAWDAIHNRLWVRESFWYQEWLGLPSSEPQPIHYTADGNTECLEDYKQKPSIFMPRWASRITLEITNVRVERLQDISEADAIAEGVYTNEQAIEKLGLPSDAKLSGTCVDKYRIVWESINGKKYSWASNPWVWVISFKRLEPVLAESEGV
jgi:hypothetical protein